MAAITIYHNPMCSTSRTAVKILEDEGIETEIFLYLKEKITKRTLKSVLKKLKMNARDIIREKEELFQEKYVDLELSEDEWLNILIQNPVLIERPILIKGRRAIIGRPLEKINKFLRIKKV